MVNGNARLPIALRHVSIRVPWHDAAWDGTVCRIPKGNAACLVLKEIRDTRNDDLQQQLAGRSIAQLDAMLGQHARRFAVAGSHGAERRTPEDGHVAAERPASLETAAEALRVYAEANALVYEAKSLGAGLHYRMAPAFEADAVSLAEELARTHGLTLQRGKMMVELRTPGAHKGDSVGAFMAEAPFAGATPVFVGDDITDEDGFVAAEALGGYGVLVGEPRDTAARYRLGDVDAVLDWIAP